MGRVILGLGAALGVVIAMVAPASAAVTVSEGIRAAYFYSYMDLDHADSLAQRGFDRGIVHFIGDSLDAGQVTQLRDLSARASLLDFTVVPQWSLQAPSRLEGLGTSRRYTWGKGNVGREVGCPLDSVFWRSTLIDRAEETLAAAPEIRKLAVDLEIYDAGVSHYSAGACRCAACLAEYTGHPGDHTASDAWRLSGLLPYEEARLGHLLTRLLTEFAARHPGVELGVFDLDRDSFVHRALARALRRAGVPTADYCERSYSSGGQDLEPARARLASLGLASAPLIGGLWLKRFAPRDVAAVVQSIASRADGYFVFTTYSLWLEPRLLSGPYTLAGRPADYWRALSQVNHAP
jgi:hypothetical protein